MAYRTAEQERWQKEDFVIGFEVKRSGRGYPCPVCEALAGKYPKTFVWATWLPNCMCYAVPILMSRDEFFAWYGRGEAPKSKDEVTDLPDRFKEWIQKNETRIQQAGKNGTLPYFIRDNHQHWDALKALKLKGAGSDAIIVPASSLSYRPPKPKSPQTPASGKHHSETPKTPQLTPAQRSARRHAARTPEQRQEIQARWDKRKALYKEYGQLLAQEQGTLHAYTQSIHRAIARGEKPEAINSMVERIRHKIENRIERRKRLVEIVYKRYNENPVLKELGFFRIPSPTGEIYFHKDGDIDKSDSLDVIEIAKLFAQKGSNIKIMPRVHVRDSLYPKIFGKLWGTKFWGKCPDLEIDGKFYEYKGYSGTWSVRKIRNQLHSGLQQASRIIIDIRGSRLTNNYITKRAYEWIEKGVAVDEVWALNDDIRLMLGMQSLSLWRGR